MSRKKTLKNTKPFYFPITKEIVGRNGEENKKTIPFKFQFLHYIRFVKAHYQMLLIMLLMEFIKLHANMDLIIKNVKHMELNTKIAAVNNQTMKMI